MNTTSDIASETHTDRQANETATQTSNDIPPSVTPTPVTSSSSNEAARNMVVGGIWCIGGIVVTAVTYNAVKDTGGTYFVAYGAIIFGGFQFLKGLFQMGN